MIDEIQVRNLALIRDAQIAPAAGMTAITGETGAGKTALLASCRLIMGQRADKGLVREGEAEAEVQSRLFLPIEVGVGDVPVGEAEREVVVARRIGADGRSHVRMNGEMVSVSELADAVAPAIDICSQHDHRMLTKPQEQRRYLDLWCGNDSAGLLGAYEEAYERACSAAQALDEVRKSKSLSDARIEDARFVLRQIDAVGPTQEDYGELVSALRKSENAELLARVTSEASAALSDEGGALDALNGAVALIEDGTKADASLAKHVEALREALFTVEDVAHEIASYQDAIDLDVSELEFMQERVSAYQSLMRSYGPALEDVIAKADEARRSIEMVDHAQETELAAQRALEEAEAALAEAAFQLSDARAAGAPQFSSDVTKVMSRLEMSGAELVCEVEMRPREEWGHEGADEVRFMFRPAQGMQCRPLSRIASGGELSRVMLALHVVMGDRDGVPTLVFDEVDAGVGGATALALGDVLAELASTHQVLVVTHLAQVAALADRQYVVRKVTDDESAYTVIEEALGDKRAEEVARMLSGAMTDSSLVHARELLGRRTC